MPADHYLPPTMPGAGRSRLYPPGGDLRTARRLAPDARGTAVLYTCDLPYCRRHAQVIRSNLNALGLEVDIREFGYLEVFERAARPGEPWDILFAHWVADYADPSDFTNLLLDKRLGARLRRKLERAATLTGAARQRAYEAVSVELARDAAPWVAYAAGVSRELFAARVGCQVFQPVVGSISLAALCLRG